MRLRAWWSLTLALTASCGRAPRQSPDHLQLALSPSSFPVRLSLQQHVYVERDGQKHDFEAVLDIDQDAVTLVGLALGQRIFTLRYDGTRLVESRSSMLPRDVRGADVLSDLQLAFWPVGAIRAALPVQLTLRDSAGVRVLSRGEREIIAITYDGTPRWNGLVTLQNTELGYRLVIRSAPAEP